jgi:hypothetical protein
MSVKIDITEHIEYREEIKRKRANLQKVWAWLEDELDNWELQCQRLFIMELICRARSEVLEIYRTLEKTTETYCKQLGDDFVVWFDDLTDRRAVFLSHYQPDIHYYGPQEMSFDPNKFEDLQGNVCFRIPNGSMKYRSEPSER